MSTRIRVVGGPWPERIGREGVIVDRPAGVDPKQYPWGGCSPAEVVILLDGDPLSRSSAFHRGWTCVINRSDLVAAAYERRHPNVDFPCAQSRVCFADVHDVGCPMRKP